MFDISIAADTDSYKFGHPDMYDPTVRHLSSYGEARSDEHFDRALFAGLQGWLKSLKPLTHDDVDEMEELALEHCGLFPSRWMRRIVDVHGGWAPVMIEALPEGLVVPNRNCLYQIVDKDPEMRGIAQFIETPLLRAVWYPTTVATLSWHLKQDLLKHLNKTCDNPEEEVLFRLHDFGARGATVVEAAARGGLAHLFNFRGSDTVPALLAARRWYSEKVAAYNIPAMEHGTICSWGPDGEEAALRSAIEKFMGPGKKLSVLVDTYDLYNCVDNIVGKNLKDLILGKGGQLVVRPDSGDPVSVALYVVKSLANSFGATLNKKGYLVLHPSVRVIYGDSINRTSMSAILVALEINGFSAENVIFGMGGGLLQGVNRDTLGFAQKVSAIANGHRGWTGVAKNPVTSRQKVSKKGRLMVVQTEHGIETVPEGTYPAERNLLQPVWDTGTLLRDQTLSEIRALSDTAVAPHHRYAA